MSIRRKISKWINRKETTEYYWKLRQKTLNSKNILSRYFYGNKHGNLMCRFNASIPLTATIDEMPDFPHGLTGIFVSGGAKIGKGCTIFHQVTIGSNTLEGSKGVGTPTIGNNVYIGCGAKIIGNVTIGDNVRIGANCVVTKDIPANSTVILPAPRIIEHKETKENKFVSISNYQEQ